MKINWKQAAGRMWKDIREYKVLAFVLIAYYLVIRSIFSAFCPLVIITGFPCPGCGMTRAFLFAFTGQFVRAFHANPLVYGWILFGIYGFIQRYIRGRKIKGWQIIISILAAAMIIAYIYRMYLYFPNRPPMTFTHGSIFEKILPGYTKVLRKIIPGMW